MSRVRLRVALWHRTENFHAVSSCYRTEMLIIDGSRCDRLGKLIEVSDHRLRHVQVQLLAWSVAHAEAMCDARWYVLVGNEFRFYAVPPMVRDLGSSAVRAFAAVD